MDGENEDLKDFESDEAGNATGEAGASDHQETDENGKVKEGTGKPTGEADDAAGTGVPGQDGEAEGGDDEGQDDGGEDGDKKGPKKLSHNERIQQLIDERKEDRKKIEALEEKLNQSTKKPDFVEVDFDKINQHIADTEKKISDLREAGKHLEARKAQRSLDKLMEDIEKNEERRKAWETDAKAEADRQKSTDEKIQALSDAAEFYASENKIPKETWDHLGALFEAELQKNKVLAREFAERADTGSPVAVIRWAHKYTVENLLEDPSKVADQKKQAKEKASSATKTSGGGEKPAELPKTYDELMKLPQKQRDYIYKNDRKLFTKLCENP